MCEHDDQGDARSPGGLAANSERTRCRHGCRGRGAQPEGFVVPGLLLLLVEKPSHGYDLVDRLESELGVGPLDPGGVYRNLRRMEEDGFIESTWETGEVGPARRTYRITAEGRELLDVWAETIARNRRLLEDFLARFNHLSGRGGDKDV